MKLNEQYDLDRKAPTATAAGLPETAGASVASPARVAGPVAEGETSSSRNLQWAAIARSCDDAIIGQTLAGIVTNWNPAAERIFGYSAAEMNGLTTRHLIPPELGDDEAQILVRIERGERIHHPDTVRVRKDGSRVHLAVTISPILDDACRIIGASTIAEDVTGRRGLEEQSRQAQKMEAIGHLAGGIAHDFSNILTVINAYTGILLSQPGVSEETREHLNQLACVAERASSLPRQLLTFSRKQVARPAVLDLNQIVGSVAKMLTRVIGEDVHLRLECLADLPPVYADAGMIEQVLMNLALNARDAMPRGGQLAIRTSRLLVDEAFMVAHPLARPGDFVIIEVGDTGYGMKPEVMAHIFEPFFTTKPPGEGTGLGLATVFSIAQQHQGWVEVQSEMEQGTVFRVFLPRAPAGSLAGLGAADLKKRRGSETILLVEDEPQVRRLALRTLEKEGYRVIAAASAVAALAVWNQHGSEIDLLMTDMVMPDGMNGVELIDTLRLLNPRLKAVLMSGYCMESSEHGQALKDDVIFFQKPYPPGKLSEIARAALDG